MLNVSWVQTASGSGPDKMNKYSQRRQVIRDTWLPFVHETAGVQAFFVCGMSDDMKAQAAIEQEASAKGDFVILGVPVRFCAQSAMQFKLPLPVLTKRHIALISVVHGMNRVYSATLFVASYSHY